MVISYSADAGVQAKTKNETVQIGAEIKIGSYEIKGAGEYDISGIQCETHTLSSGLVSFIRAEELTLTFLSTLDSEVTKLDDASNCDILVVGLRSDNKAEDLKPILKSLEPAYLFLIGEGSDPEFGKALGLPIFESSTLKVTRSSLPLEGTTLVPLS